MTTERRSYLLVGLAVFAVAVGTRALPLLWSPLPFNPDGIHFAALARYTLTDGRIPVGMRAFHTDEYAFTTLLATVALLAERKPLYVAQPMIAAIGAVPPLVAVVLARRVGTGIGWHGRDVRVAAAVAGLLLAIEGLYLRRSTAVSSEVAGLLLVALLALAFHRALDTRRPAWFGATAMIIVVLPITHNLSTIQGALAVTALLAMHVHHRPTIDTASIGGLLVLGFWGYLAGYYSIVGLGELSRISGAPGLFLAWVIVLVGFVLWLSTTSIRIQRGIPMAGLATGASVLTANAVTPVFPETANTPLTLLALVAPLVVIGAFATWGLPRVTVRGTDGVVVVGLLLGPITLIGFGLTASLTPGYRSIVVRSQTFVHLAVMTLAALAAVGIARVGRSDRAERSALVGTVRRGVVPLVLVCAVLSAPLAFSGLTALAYQSTTTPAEFATTQFAATTIDERWTGDEHVTRVARNYYPTRANESFRPVYSWLDKGAAPPACPTVSQQSWTTTGAQLFPGAPTEIDADRYRAWIDGRNVVYTAGSADPLTITVPNEGRSGC